MTKKTEERSAKKKANSVREYKTLHAENSRIRRRW